MQRRLWIWGGIAIAVIMVITLFAAPNSNKLMAGSTYGKEPNGYGAWYEYMSAKGTDIQRWQKPFTDFIEDQKDRNKDDNATYLKIIPPHRPELSGISNQESAWVEQGNTLVILGKTQPATAAAFKTNQSYQDLTVAIATTRRNEDSVNNILEDEYGAIIWRDKIKQGEVIYATTPYIGANAYQDVENNFEFLAKIVSENSSIFVDEYIHGYKDLETKIREKQGTLRDYFLQTPWYPMGIQLIIVMLVAITFSWHRFGKPIIPQVEKLDNSQAYIEALARVLEKAESTDFIVETIAKDEQRKLQKYLGLGRNLLDETTLVNAWQQQTGQSPSDLQELLQKAKSDRRISEAELVKWIQKWQKINKNY